MTGQEHHLGVDGHRHRDGGQGDDRDDEHLQPERPVAQLAKRHGADGADDEHAGDRDAQHRQPVAAHDASQR